jgi:CDP-diacylglycerol--glycerol-3-phosphate 3-phosphatidyltransferase
MTGLWTLPNLLSIFRLVSAPVLVLLALAGHREGFLLLLAVGFASDAVDGIVARGTGQTTQLGARLDSLADVAVYSAMAIALFLLWPELVRRELVAFSAIVLSFTVPALVGLARFGRFTSYHTILTKLAVGVTAVGFYVMVFDLSVWPFRIAALFAVLAALEEIAITTILPEERSNVWSLGRVLRERRRDSGA